MCTQCEKGVKILVAKREVNYLILEAETVSWSGDFAWYCSYSGVRRRMDVFAVEYGAL
jgi:hypothetical protein